MNYKRNLTQHSIEKDDDDDCGEVDVVDWRVHQGAPQQGEDVVVHWDLLVAGLQHQVLWKQTECWHAGDDNKDQR